LDPQQRRRWVYALPRRGEQAFTGTGPYGSSFRCHGRPSRGRAAAPVGVISGYPETLSAALSFPLAQRQEVEDHLQQAIAADHRRPA